MTILIVEDDEALARSIWRRFMQPLSDDIRIAHNLADALAEMRKLPPPDLVLLDLILPKAAGSQDYSTAENTLASIRQIKAINPCAVVLVLTGAVEASLPALAAQLGADGFRPKDSVIGQERLLRAIQDVLTCRVKEPGEPAYARSLQLYEKLTALLPPCTVESS